MVSTDTGAAAASTSHADPASGHTWEDAGGQQSWEQVVREDQDGNLIVVGEASTAQAIRKRRKRLEQTDYSQRCRRVVRDMIRYMYVVLDISRWMREKDSALTPGTRLEVTTQILADFIQEFFDQNPLSHLGLILLRNGEAEILTHLSSSSKTHKVALQSVMKLAGSEGPNGGGEFSLQNGLELAGRSLGHQPRHGSREIVVLCGALSTCDPGNILVETLPRLQTAQIRVSTLALSAEMNICRKLAQETGGVMGVALDKSLLRDWLLVGQCVPPPSIVTSSTMTLACEMVSIGFPTRTSGDVPTLVHASREAKLLARMGFDCPQCQAKASELPTACAVCGLQLIVAPHLARSFHHLFPVSPFSELPESVAAAAGAVITHLTTTFEFLDPCILVSSDEKDQFCYACLKMIGISEDHPSGSKKLTTQTTKLGKNGPVNNKKCGGESLRFQCLECRNIFCADCDAYLHETLHNCPGCLSKS